MSLKVNNIVALLMLSDNVCYHCTVLGSLTLRLICEELKEVTYKWFEIGVQLGIPHYKLKEFQKEDNPLTACSC